MPLSRKFTLSHVVWQCGVQVAFGAGPLGIALGWESGGAVVVEAVGAQAEVLGVRAGDVLVGANGAVVPLGVTDVELAALLDLEAGKPPRMVFERAVAEEKACVS